MFMSQMVMSQTNYESIDALLLSTLLLLVM